jgi:phosphoribosylaminoimidazole-succinocarboxamide synthase
MTVDLAALAGEQPLVRGSVQTIYGWERDAEEFLVCEATDAGSAFDIGPYFTIPGSGCSRTELRHAVFLRLAAPDRWRSLTRTDIDSVVGIAEGNRFWHSPTLAALRLGGAATHHVGLVDPDTGIVTDRFVPTPISLVRRFPVVKPVHFTRNGHPAWDYHPCHLAEDKLIPLEHIFRIGSPAGSSLLLRYRAALAAEDEAGAAKILTEAGLDGPVTPWKRFGRMPYDCSTKYENHDRYLDWQEAVHVSGVDHEILVTAIDLLAMCTVATSSLFASIGFSLWDIKWEAAVAGGAVVVVDTVDHDSVRITRDQTIDGRTVHVHFNKQAVRDYYRILHPEWVEALDDAKALEKADPAERPFREIYDASVTSGIYPPIPELDPAYGEIQARKYDVVAGGASGRYRIEDCPELARAAVDAEIDYYRSRGRADQFLAHIGGT